MMKTGLELLAKANHRLASPITFLALLPENFEDLTAEDYKAAMESVRQLTQIFNQEREIIHTIVREEIGELPIT